MKYRAAFDEYACVNDWITMEVNGIEYRARIEHDPDHHIDDDDCHNMDQFVTGCNNEQFSRLLKCRQAWINNEWFYCGVVISAHKAGVCIDDYAASLWAIECNYPGTDNSYLTDVANELLAEAIESAKDVLERLAA